MFHAVIVEDEKPILDLMKVIIGRSSHYTIIGAFTNPLEALEFFSDIQPDVVFIDVEMPRMNGIELAQRIRALSDYTQIVFTTAYKNYALDAFDVNALDYILKPVTADAIERVTNRLIRMTRTEILDDKKMKHASIKCLGQFEVRNSAGVLIRYPTRKTEELLAYFLCHSGQDISKWHLVDFLWPDTLGDRALHNLHNTIYRLKKLLKEQEVNIDIQKTNEGYLLETMNQTYDVLAFKQYDFSLPVDMWDLDQADSLCSEYIGPLLDKKPYLWKTPLEEGFRKQYTSLVRQLVHQDTTKQDWDKSEQRLEAYLSIYPLNEEMNLEMMKIYSYQGNKEKICDRYARFEAFYRSELGLELPQELRERMAPYLNQIPS